MCNSLVFYSVGLWALSLIPMWRIRYFVFRVFLSYIGYLHLGCRIPHSLIAPLPYTTTLQLCQVTTSYGPSRLLSSSQCQYWGLLLPTIRDIYQLPRLGPPCAVTTGPPQAGHGSSPCYSVALTSQFWK